MKGVGRLWLRVTWIIPFVDRLVVVGAKYVGPPHHDLTVLV